MEKKIESEILIEENELDFIQKLTIFASAILVFSALWFTWSVYNGSISLVGPSKYVTEQEERFDEIIDYDKYSHLTGNGVSVCIVDSGIEDSHPDLAKIDLAGWTDFIGNQSQPYDDNGHGTMMAGILVADGGLSGVAKDVKLYVAKALSGNGTGSDTIVAQAIDWCISKNVNIISLSLGGATTGASIIFGDAVENSVDDAYDAGIVVVAAAGNDGENDDGDVASPGTVSTVICVGGVDSQGNLWSGSSIGDNNGRIWPILLPRNDPDRKPEVVAPGHEVPVIMTGDSWGISSGTSASTVYVTGAIALMFENNPNLMGGGTDMLDDLKEWIATSSKMKNGQDSHDNHYGYGLLQIGALIDAAG